ncbi:hypothetical protein jhhlp_007947 [Lomentospora prolificans]|uniref:Uncharacterized protein n=1 Tax=Lomentospora prolificans TaxID=41688 RepID=A0A2N3N106_9PEZI|nr:hypothetical protein jhhlp_007947 [Lomentospora prolificans]
MLPAPPGGHSRSNSGSRTNRSTPAPPTISSNFTIPPGQGQLILYDPNHSGPVFPEEAVVLYEDMVFTAFNCGGNQLAPFCHNVLQWNLLALPGQPVVVVRGSIRPAQVFTMRPSYINALLIQSRGQVSTPPCTECQRLRAGAQDRLNRPFPVCVRTPGHFGGACGNYKWRDHAARCMPGDDQGGDDEMGDDGMGGGGRVRTRRTQGRYPALPAAGSSSENPIVL